MSCQSINRYEGEPSLHSQGSHWVTGEVFPLTSSCVCSFAERKQLFESLSTVIIQKKALLLCPQMVVKAQDLLQRQAQPFRKAILVSPLVIYSSLFAFWSPGFLIWKKLWHQLIKRGTEMLCRKNTLCSGHSLTTS